MKDRTAKPNAAPSHRARARTPVEVSWFGWAVIEFAGEQSRNRRRRHFNAFEPGPKNTGWNYPIFHDCVNTDQQLAPL
jgi:hypothetical protein